MTGLLVVGLFLAPAASVGGLVLVLAFGGAWWAARTLPGQRRTAAEAEYGVQEIEAWLHRRRHR